MKQPWRRLSDYLKPSVLLLFLFSAAAYVAQVSPCISRSFWIDEAATLALSAGTFSETFWRSYQFSGQSPFYYLLLRTLRGWGGNSEIFLRSSSLLCFVLFIFCLYAAARLLFDRRVALYSLPFALLHPAFVLQSYNLRPYSLALAASMASIVCLLLYCRSPSRLLAGGLVLSLSVAIYAQYLYGCIVLVHLLIITQHRLRSQCKARLSTLAGLYAITAMIVLPAVGQILIIGSSGAQRDFGPALGWAYIWNPYDLYALMPFVLLVALMAFKVLFQSGRQRAFAEHTGAVRLCFGWYLISLAAKVLLTAVTGHSVFPPRYWSWGLPPSLMVLAFLIAAIEPPRVRGLIPVMLSIVFAVGSWKTSDPGRCYVSEDWRAAARLAIALGAGEGTPIFVYSGHSETRFEDWLSDPTKVELMLSPVTVYKLTGRLLLLPFSLTEPRNAAEELRGQVDKAAALQPKKVFLLAREDMPRDLSEFLIAGLAGHGYRLQAKHSLSGVVLQEFVEKAGNDSASPSLRETAAPPY